MDQGISEQPFLNIHQWFTFSTMGIQRMTQYDLIFTFMLPIEPMIDIYNYDDVD
jgi:hypothetical protein